PTVVGQPAVPALARRGVRPHRGRVDPDSAGQQLGGPGGGSARSRFSRWVRGWVAVALEVRFEPVPLRPVPALRRSAAPLQPAVSPSEGQIPQGWFCSSPERQGICRTLTTAQVSGRTPIGALGLPGPAFFSFAPLVLPASTGVTSTHRKSPGPIHACPEPP